MAMQTLQSDGPQLHFLGAHIPWPREAIMSDNDGAGFWTLMMMWWWRWTIVKTTTHKHTHDTLTSLSFVSQNNEMKKKKVMWNLTWSKLRYAPWFPYSKCARLALGLVEAIWKFNVPKVFSVWWHCKHFFFCCLMFFRNCEMRKSERARVSVQVDMAHLFRCA